MRSLRGLTPLVAAVVLLAGCGTDEDAALLPNGRALAVERSFDSSLHLFGDTVTAHVEIVVDRRLLDPERLDLETDFEPYELVGSELLERRVDGPYTRLRYRADLRCLTEECIPGVLASAAGAQESGRGERTTFRFAPVRILYQEPDQANPELLRFVTWPALVSVSRINEVQAGAAFPFRASTSPLPDLTANVAPFGLAVALVVLALALLAWPAWLVASWWRRRRPVPELPVAEPPTPLESALALVEWACAQPHAAPRREALERLAAVLAESSANGLVAETRTLAWSPASPSADDTSEIVRRVRKGDAAPA
jgi:hypothetical protein